MSVLHKTKLWFWPHQHNNHHPKLLSFSGMTVVLVLVLGIVMFYNFASLKRTSLLGFQTDISTQKIVDETNQARSAQGLGNLKTSPALQQAAAAKAEDMFQANYWAHVSPGGNTPWQFITASGYRYEKAGENLAKGFATSKGVIDGWLASPSHRENLLGGQYQEIGVAIKEGKLGGQTTTLVVALYASPARAPSLIPTTYAAEQGAEYSITNPLLTDGILGWGAKLSILVLAVVLLVYVNAHIQRRRKKIKGHKLGYSFPQAAVVTTLIALIIATGFGSVL